MEAEFQLTENIF